MTESGRTIKEALVQQRKRSSRTWTAALLAFMAVMFCWDTMPPNVGFIVSVVSLAVLMWAGANLDKVGPAVLCNNCKEDLSKLMVWSKIPEIEKLKYCPFCATDLTEIK